MKSEVSINQDPDEVVISVVVNGITFKPEIQEKVVEKMKLVDIKAWDVNTDDKRPQIILPTKDGLRSFCFSGDCCYSENGICKGAAVLGFYDDAYKLLNLLDLVTEMRKVTNGKTNIFNTNNNLVVADGVRVFACDSIEKNGVCITIEKEDDKNRTVIKISYADAFRFAAQLLSFCRKGKK